MQVRRTTERTVQELRGAVTTAAVTHGLTLTSNKQPAVATSAATEGDYQLVQHEVRAYLIIQLKPQCTLVQYFSVIWF